MLLHQLFYELLPGVMLSSCTWVSFEMTTLILVQCHLVFSMRAQSILQQSMDFSISRYCMQHKKSDILVIWPGRCICGVVYPQYVTLHLLAKTQQCHVERSLWLFAYYQHPHPWSSKFKWNSLTPSFQFPMKSQLCMLQAIGVRLIVLCLCFSALSLYLDLNSFAVNTERQFQCFFYF